LLLLLTACGPEYGLEGEETPTPAPGWLSDEPALDVLLVVDPSGSLDNDQWRVQWTLEHSVEDLAEIRRVDWRIRLVSTDPRDGPWGNWDSQEGWAPDDLSWEVAMALGALQTGGQLEHGLAVASAQRDWWRTGNVARLLLLVSDEDDQSNNTGPLERRDAPVWLVAVVGGQYDAQRCRAEWGRAYLALADEAVSICDFGADGPWPLWEE